MGEDHILPISEEKELKVTPSILLCQPTTSEADVGGTAVQVEPSHQYSFTFCCHVTDGSRGAAWQDSIWHGSAYKAKVQDGTPSFRKSHLLIFHWCLLNIKSHVPQKHVRSKRTCKRTPAWKRCLELLLASRCLIMGTFRFSSLRLFTT